MNKEEIKEIQIDGSRFTNLDGFYDEVAAKLTKGLDWSPGRNLDAFDDLLCGGFGVHDYEEPIVLRWTNSAKSQVDLGYPATIDRLQAVLERCHPSNRASVGQSIAAAEQQQGDTLFQTIVEIIESHHHINFKIE